MPQLRDILFPVDFSDPCDQTAATVAAVASHFRAGITVLHVESVPFRAEPFDSSSPASTSRHESRDASTKAMSRFLARHFASTAVKCLIQEGDPAQAIVALADEHACDLVMMPTHGCSLFRQLVGGSVTARVLHEASCPVWTSAHVAVTEPQLAFDCRVLICAVDRASDSVDLLRWADWFARAYQATLKIVHVIPAFDETSQNCGEVELGRYLLKVAQSDFRSLMERSGVEKELLLRGGDVAGRLAETARRQDADLLIVGRGQVQKILGRLRTHLLGIIRDSPCPVISV